MNLMETIRIYEQLNYQQDALIFNDTRYYYRSGSGDCHYGHREWLKGQY
ncbi:hypothetical protein [Paenibacillus sp. FSL L8-0641]